MRLPYVPEDPQLENADDQATVERVKQRRGGTLIALDRALLHAPPIANGWNAFLGSVRTQNSLPDSIRELAMCRVAVLNQAWYEWHSHAPILEATNVLSADAVKYIRERPHGASSPPEGLLDEKHAAVLEYVDKMTIGCIVPDPLFQKIKTLFDERQVVEITATIAAYNCVSRFLVALDVGEMREKYGIDMS
ncbi:hypothetical protein MBLNU459_g0962t1 [Dothideomycetes sp. NU459]